MMVILIAGNSKKSSYNQKTGVFFGAGERNRLLGALHSAKTTAHEQIGRCINILDKIPAMKLITIIRLQ
jgi:hypothetical protein